MVFTSLCPNSSCTVRISEPPSSKWVANECRKVCRGRDFPPLALLSAGQNAGRRLAGLAVDGYVEARQ